MYKISNIICPYCLFNDVRELGEVKHWCPDCDAHFDIVTIRPSLKSMPDKLPEDWRSRELK